MTVRRVLRERGVAIDCACHQPSSCRPTSENCLLVLEKQVRKPVKPEPKSTSAISLANSAYAGDNSRLRKHFSAAAPAQGVAVPYSHSAKANSLRASMF